MLHTRRTFLNTGLAVVGTCASAPSFLTKAAAQVQRPRDTDQHRVLVVLQLSGGNDGLNTLVPFADPAYRNARPVLGVPQRDVIDLHTDPGLGLHPNLGPVADLLLAGRASIVQGVGYPNPNRSHFASMDVWHTGDALHGATGGRGTGWIGRALDQRDPADPLAVVSLGPDAPLAATGQPPQPIAVESAARVRYPGRARPPARAPAAAGQTTKPIAFEPADLFRYTGRDLHPAIDHAYDTLLNATETPPTHDRGSTAPPTPAPHFLFPTPLHPQLP